MDVQPITYRGRIVTACTSECFLLADDLAYRAPGDPELVFVVAMCSYATDIAQGLLFDEIAAPVAAGRDVGQADHSEDALAHEDPLAGGDAVRASSLGGLVGRASFGRVGAVAVIMAIRPGLAPGGVGAVAGDLALEVHACGVAGALLQVALDGAASRRSSWRSMGSGVVAPALGGAQPLDLSAGRWL